MAESTLRIKARIKTSKNIAQITRAMEMVSASKMRRAQARAVAGQPYSRELAATLLRLTVNLDPQTHPLLRTNPATNPVLIVLFSSEKGLAGGLNTNLFIHTERMIRKLTSPVEFITIGKKARNYVAKTGRTLLASFIDLGDRPTAADLTPIAQLIVTHYQQKSYHQVNAVYQDFISTLVQKPKIVNLFPLGTPEEIIQQSLGLDAHETRQILKQTTESSTEYLFEPDPQSIINWLLPYYVENRLYQIQLESLASEHSARMVAMKNAHDAAKDIVSDLTLVYNQARQAKVTSELLDAFAARLTLNS